MCNIFVYGTLLSSEIIKTLTGKSFNTTTAVLLGYKRYCIKDGDYPAIIYSEDSDTTGKVIENVDDLSLDIISFYEGDEYEKKKVTVLLNGQLKDVLTFVWVGRTEILEDRGWDYPYFQKNFLDEYLNFVIPEILKAFRKK